MTPRFVHSGHVDQARHAVGHSGALLIADGYDRNACQEIVEWIEKRADAADLERNYAGTESRIWHAEQQHPRLQEFWAHCNVFMSELEQRTSEAYTLLAIRNRALAENDQASQRDRWHIDSFRRQLKIFLFLVDVTVETGPFEFIPRTHKAAFKVRQIARGAYLRPSDVWTGKRRYARLDDDWVQGMAARGYRPEPVVCPAGTVMIIDTSAVHRARPCFHGTRYALTAYYR